MEDINNRMLRETEKCVLCGSCKAECPTYEIVLKESFGPRGRMHLLWALLHGELTDTAQVYQRLYSCLLCGACKKRCPAEVDVPMALSLIRSRLSVGLSGRLLRAFLKGGFTNPRAYHLLFRRLYPLLKRPLIKRGLLYEGFEPQLPHPHGVFNSERGIKRGRIALFVGCSVRYLQPYIGSAFVEVCERLGYEVVISPKEACCGAPLMANGMIREAETAGRKNLETFAIMDVDIIVSVCPTCVYTMQNRYRELFGESLKVVDSVDFLSGHSKDLLRIISQKEETPELEGLIYHHPCHGLYSLGQKETPLAVLNTMGLPIKGSLKGCCGLAGTFPLRFKALSDSLLSRRIGEFQKANASLLVTSCPGCVMQLARGIGPERVLHIVEVVAEMLDSNVC